MADCFILKYLPTLGLRSICCIVSEGLFKSPSNYLVRSVLSPTPTVQISVVLALSLLLSFLPLLTPILHNR
jgi:hypothetical protein